MQNSSPAFPTSRAGAGRLPSIEAGGLFDFPVILLSSPVSRPSVQLRLAWQWQYAGQPTTSPLEPVGLTAPE